MAKFVTKTILDNAKAGDLVADLQKMWDPKVWGRSSIRELTLDKYKSFELGTVVSFDFPITVLVGANGGGKSSVLQAVAGAPARASLKKFWFSSKIDEIKDQPNQTFSYRYVAGKATKEEIRSIGEPNQGFLHQDTKDIVLARVRKARVTKQFTKKA
ncbi:AAA family ATPase [Corynebacterium pseudopelargi]|uniref:Chromosome partition protein Smc n=1 Tax=Corynebacterium pseudopelargi TaxID=2080757 RepID=A0A3G6ISP8_9CORY|nr:AAA family ATPase [Corynebacterium pseudopelargi]AZA08527.1 Chromosome partition protein Smc [Corynebacterium pseudopelargi]